KLLRVARLAVDLEHRAIGNHGDLVHRGPRSVVVAASIAAAPTGANRARRNGPGATTAAMAPHPVSGSMTACIEPVECGSSGSRPKPLISSRFISARSRSAV